jgi:hypothetical protein
VTCVDIHVLAGRNTGRGRCVIDGPLAAVELPGLDAPHAIPTAAVPEWLAGLLGVGPRPRVHAPGVLIAHAAMLDSVLNLAEPDAGAIAAMIAPDRVSSRWLELLVAISVNLLARWRVEIRAPGATTAAETLEVLDCSAAGLWMLQPGPAEDVTGDEEVVCLAPTTSTAVWAWLSRLAAAG